MIETVLALVGAGGVLGLFLARATALRLASLAAVAVGTVGLAVWLVSVHRISHDLGRRPLLAGVGLIVLAALWVVGALVLTRRPWWLLYAAVATAPIRLPVHAGGQAATLLLPLYALVACAWLAMVFELVRGARHEVLGPVVGLPLGAFGLLYALSLAWSADSRRGAIEVAFFVLPFGFLAAALSRLALRLDVLRRAAVEAVGLGVLFALVGLFQYATHHIYWNNHIKVSNTYGAFFRVNSVFYDPSVYGRYLAVAIVLVATLTVLGRLPAPAVPLVAALVMWLGLFVSYSQSSLVALAAGLLAVGALRWRRRAAVAMAAGAVALAIGVLALPQLHGVRHSLLHGSANTTTSGRSTLLRTGLRLFVHHPGWGVGGGGFIAAAAPHRNAEASGATGASHDMPATVAAELGIPGLVLLAWLLVSLVRLAARPGAAAPDSARLARLALALGIGVIGVHSLAYSDFFEDPTTWGLLALLVVCARPAATGEPPGMIGA